MSISPGKIVSNLTKIFLDVAGQVAGEGYKYLVVFPRSELYISSPHEVQSTSSDARTLDISTVSSDFVLSSASSKIHHHNSERAEFHKNAVEFVAFKTKEDQQKALAALKTMKFWGDEEKVYFEAYDWEGMPDRPDHLGVVTSSFTTHSQTDFGRAVAERYGMGLHNL